MFSLFTPAACGSRVPRTSYAAARSSLLDLLPEFGSGFSAWSTPAAVELIASDDHSATLAVDVPGIRAEHLAVEVRDDLLTLSGQRGAKPDADSPRFTRTIRLPWRAETQQVDASLDHGVLTITVRRADEDKPHRVAIRTV